MPTNLLRSFGVKTTINFTIYDIAGTSFNSTAVFEIGDVKISKAEGAEVNTTNLPVDRGQYYSIALSAAEMFSSRIVLLMVDAPTKVWRDESIIIDTFGGVGVGVDVVFPPADPSLCAVSLFPSVNAISGGLKFSALPGEVVGSRLLDTTEIEASVVDSAIDYYSAVLVRKGRYRIIAPRFPVNDLEFTVPDAGTATLTDLIDGLRKV